MSLSINKEKPVIAWWSGGITSAIVCHLCIDWFGIDNVRIIFIDTKSEDDDTYRFKKDCENWYGKAIETITNENYANVEKVWFKFLSLNVANGAICSTEMKRWVRERFQKDNTYSYQAFGFDITELKRAQSMSANYPSANAFFPLIARCLRKQDCINMLPNDLLLKVEPPRTYIMGYLNNNCFKRGCVQGGIGYWQKMKREFPAKVKAMAKVEHELTDLKGKPVTMLKDQSKGGGLVFLEKHPKYPHIKDLSMMKGREPKPLMECNGFCGTNDLEKNETEKEINYQIQ